MPVLLLQTLIRADIVTCFDLSRSIDLHKISTEQTNETAIKGCTSGLIGFNEFVTWKATHFGIRQQLTTKITAFDRPFHFRDEQIKGIFKSMVHDHYFEEREGIVVMNDVFEFHSPFGILGKLADQMILVRYLYALLQKRNHVIKDFAETDQWNRVL